MNKKTPRKVRKLDMCHADKWGLTMHTYYFFKNSFYYNQVILAVLPWSPCYIIMNIIIHMNTIHRQCHTSIAYSIMWKIVFLLDHLHYMGHLLRACTLAVSQSKTMLQSLRIHKICKGIISNLLTLRYITCRY